MREAVRDIEGEHLPAAGEPGLAVAARPAAPGGVELIGLVDELERPRKARMSGAVDRKQRDLRRRTLKKCLARKILAQILTPELSLDHFGAPGRLFSHIRDLELGRPQQGA